MFDNNQPNKTNSADLTQINQGKPYPFTPVNPAKKISGLKSPVEDILASTESFSTNKTSVNEKTETNAVPIKDPLQVPAMERPLGNKIFAHNAQNINSNLNNSNNEVTKKSPIIYLIFFLIILIFGVAGFFAYKYFFQDKNTESLNNSATSNKNLENLLNDLKTVSPAEDATPVVEEKVVDIDTDVDGLTDAEELELGTNPTQIDTDFDGLTDIEEINIYKTDPAKQDTDGDTYNDGAEVKNGFDPALPGDAKLVK